MTRCSFETPRWRSVLRVFGTTYWLVIRGKPVRGRRALAIMAAIEDTIAIMAEEDDPEPLAPLPGGSDAMSAIASA